MGDSTWANYRRTCETLKEESSVEWLRVRSAPTNTSCDYHEWRLAAAARITICRLQIDYLIGNAGKYSWLRMETIIACTQRLLTRTDQKLVAVSGSTTSSFSDQSFPTNPAQR